MSKPKPPIALTKQETKNLDFLGDDISFFTARVFEVEDRLVVDGKIYEIDSIELQKDQPQTPKNPKHLPYNVIATPKKPNSSDA